MNDPHTPAGVEGAPTIPVGGAVARPPADQKVADQKIGRYEVLRVLGRGGMGLVYLARDPALDRLVAVKVLVEGEHASADMLARFQIEAQAIARVQHPHIAQVFEVGNDGGRPFLVMEYLAGGTLADRIREQPLTPIEAAATIETLARAMQAAHAKGIVHRDLKPGNVLLAADGALKITDFGLAKRLDTADAATMTGDILGSPSYMAPEQAGGVVKNIGPSCDIYALGAVLYELLTCRPPFRAPDVVQTLLMVLSAEPVSVRRLQPQVPRDLATICQKCLEKSPKRRYATAVELADDLDRFRRGLPISARPVGRVERILRWAKRRPAAAALAVVSVAAATTLVAGGIWYNSRLQASNRQLQTELDRSKQLVAEGNHLAQFVLEDHFREISKLRGGSIAQMRLIEQFEKYLSGLAATAADADPLLRTIARSWLRLAQIQGETDSFNLGDPAGALASCDEAQRLYERAINYEPDDAELRLGMLNCRRTAIQLRTVLDLPQDEQAELHRLLHDVQNLASSGKIESDRLQAIECGVRADLGWSKWTHGQLDEAVNELRLALRGIEQLIASGTDAARHESTGSTIRSHLAQVLREQGELDESLEQTQWLIHYAERQVAAAPTDAQRLRSKALSLKLHGDTLAQQLESADAMTAYRSAEKILRSLRSDDPDNAMLIGDLTNLLDSISSALRVKKDFAGGKAAAEEGLLLNAKLLEREPRQVELRRREWILRNALGDCQNRLGDQTGAVVTLEKALEIEDQLLDENVTRIADREGLGETHFRLGNAWFARGASNDGNDADFEQAVMHYRQCLKTYAELEASGPLGPNPTALQNAARKMLELVEETQRKLKAVQ